MCGDSKKDHTMKRGWVYFNNGEVPSYHCFNEGCTAKGVGLLAKIQGISYKEAFAQVVQRYRGDTGDEIDLDDIDDEFRLDDDGIFKSIPDAVSKEMGFIIPSHWRELDDNCNKIISTRQVMSAPYAPANWKLYLDVKNDRIVIPWTKDGEIIGYQLRAIYKDQTPKYKFEADHEKPIFGLDNIDYSHKFGYMLEGIFDSIFVMNGLAIGGIQLSNTQSEIMVNYPLMRVYLLDNQWVDPSSKRETLKLLERGERVFIWPKGIKAKDVNEHVVSTGENPFIDPEFLQANTYNGAKGILRFKFNK
jgi:hypothetical protein